ncbi:hypothetical protein L6R52_25580 [Myxococcota bacterium]|nr:hypothetical protein [Myxococcota bacterium]
MTRLVRASSVGLALVASCATLAGCGCATDADGWEVGRPRIDALRFLQQSPRDPHAVELSLAFTDADGDVSEGTLEMYLDGALAAERPMAEVFASQVPPLAPDATGGEVELIVRLDGDFPAGRRVEIGFVLDERDGDCARSNAPSIVLQATSGGGV